MYIDSGVLRLRTSVYSAHVSIFKLHVCIRWSLFKQWSRLLDLWRPRNENRSSVELYKMLRKSYFLLLNLAPIVRSLAGIAYAFANNMGTQFVRKSFFEFENTNERLISKAKFETHLRVKCFQSLYKKMNKVLTTWVEIRKFNIIYFHVELYSKVQYDHRIY